MVRRQPGDSQVPAAGTLPLPFSRLAIGRSAAAAVQRQAPLAAHQVLEVAAGTFLKKKRAKKNWKKNAPGLGPASSFLVTWSGGRVPDRPLFTVMMIGLVSFSLLVCLLRSRDRRAWRFLSFLCARVVSFFFLAGGSSHLSVSFESLCN